MKRIKSYFLLSLTLSFIGHDACSMTFEGVESFSHQTTSSFLNSSLFDEPFDIVHPCVDFGFKKAFHVQEVACGFLNTILDFKDNDIITNVLFLDKDLPSHSALGRDFTVDILCETKDHRRFLVEMQNDFRADYATKAYTEFCRLIAYWDAEVIHQEATEQTYKRARANETYSAVKEYWKDIKQAIVVVITNKRFAEGEKKTLFSDFPMQEPEIINIYRMMHENGKGRPLGDLDARVVLVMLDNFKKSEEELESKLDQWLYAFKDESLQSGLQRIPTYKHIHSSHKVGTDKEDLKSFYKALHKTTVRLAGELEKYEQDIVNVNAILTRREEEKRLEGIQQGLIEGEQIGLEKGKIIGIEEGEEKAKREMALEMFRDGEPDQRIIKYAKISQIELDALKSGIS